MKGKWVLWKMKHDLLTYFLGKTILISKINRTYICLNHFALYIFRMALSIKWTVHWLSSSYEYFFMKFWIIQVIESVTGQ